MKLVMLLAGLVVSGQVWAQSSFTAVPFAQVIEETLSQEVEFRDQAMVFGYYSIQSCLYSGVEVSVLQHYCFPKRNYPARSFTLISKTFGVVYLYEEDLGPIVERRVVIRVFPEDFNAHVAGPIDQWMIEDWNKVYSHFYNQPNVACWSTNYSRYQQGPDSRCTNGDIADFKSWSDETMALTADPKQWDQVFELLNRLIL